MELGTMAHFVILATQRWRLWEGSGQEITIKASLAKKFMRPHLSQEKAGNTSLSSQLHRKHK
jgi:hypothetical protein